MKNSKFSWLIRRKLSLVLMLAMLLASCKDERKPVTGGIVGVEPISGTDKKTTSRTTTGMAFNSGGGVTPVIGTSTYSETVPCEYGLIKIDYTGDGITDYVISLKLSDGKQAVHYFRAKEMLDKNMESIITYLEEKGLFFPDEILTIEGKVR